MEALTKVLALGLYVPIVLMSGAASWLLWTRLVLPIWRAKSKNLDRYALGLGATFAMFSHTVENIIFGAGRWNTELKMLLLNVHFAVVGKVLILIGAVFTLAALSRAETDKAHIKRLFALALLLWVVGSVLAMLFANTLGLQLK